MPVWLRYNTYTKPLGFKKPSDNGSTERRMVYIGISTEKYYISTIPPAKFHLFSGGR
jgi:hypothetical protein